MSDHSMQFSILAVALIVAAPAAMARETSYDFVQGSYFSVSDSSFPGHDIDGDGFGISGSISVARKLAVTASYATINYDEFQGVDIDSTEFSLGLTAHAPIASSTDVQGNLSLLKVDLEASGNSADGDENDTGFSVGLGLRHRVSNALELDAGVNYTDVFDDNSTAFGFGGRFYPVRTISVGVAYSTSSDVDVLNLNVRLDF